MSLRPGAGMRAVSVRLEMIELLLHGQTVKAEAINVPEDMTVFGSLSRRITRCQRCLGTVEQTDGFDPYPANAVVFLCQSTEWDPGEDFIGGEHATFEPQFRRIA